MRDMFIDVREPSITLGTQKRYTVVGSVIVHSAIIAAVIIAPLVATDVLPAPPVTTIFVSPAIPTAPAPPRILARRTTVERPDASLAPVRPPSAFTSESPGIDRSGEATRVIGGGDVLDGIAGGIVTDGADALPPPPPTQTSSPSEPRRVGGKISAPLKIRDVKPIYPPIAQTARVQGVVIIEATIGPDGMVQVARVLRSIPLLDQAALDAVRQWQFTPSFLNGVAVPVIMTVTVNFELR
jgi:protein TonB